MSVETAVDPSATAESNTEIAQPEPPADQRRLHLLSLVALAAAILPMVVAAVRAIRDGWVPVGDSALIAIRARDVLGEGELPLLGMWSSQSWVGEVDFNHPGPLFYDLLAPPAALFPGGTGLVLGAVMISVLSLVGVYLVARRIGGPLMALAATCAAALLSWSMGSDVLVEPWHANTLLLPFLCFLLLIWAVVTGDLPCLPWAVFVGSLLLQTNLGFSTLVPVPLIGAIVVVVVARRRGDDAEGPRVRRLGIATGVVFLACWAQPLAEQLFSPGEGNFSRVITGSGDSRWTLNWMDSIRSVAKVLAVPPWGWGNDSFAGAFRFGPFGNPLPSLGLAVAALSVLVGALAWCWRSGRRRGDTVAAAGLGLAVLLVVLSIVTANVTPGSEIGAVGYQMRWLWPVGVFVPLAFVAFGIRRLGSTTWCAVPLAVATLVLAGSNLVPAHRGTTAPHETLAVARALVEELEDAELDGPLLVQCDEGIYGPYCETVMYELQRRGTPFVVSGRVEVRQLGDQRRWTGENAAAVLRVSAGDSAVLPPPEARQVALHPGLADDRQLDLFYLQAEIREAADDGAIRLNERGRRVARREDFASVDLRRSVGVVEAKALDVRRNPFGEYLRDLVAMVEEDLLDVDDALAEKLERYVDLQVRWDVETVGVFVLPIASAED